jgi:Fe(3+) dicitrate transport protein
MPGGLTDGEFTANPGSSFRARNWLASPWNILASTTTIHLSPAATLTTTLSGMASERYLVWRNEYGGPQALDTIDPATGQFSPREVQREVFGNGAAESRLGVAHTLFGMRAELATGLRYFDGTMHRQGGGPGTTGSDFNMSVTGPFGYDLHFGTRNVAAYAEEALHVTDRLTITPGLRGEWLASSIHGENQDSATFAIPNASHTRTFALAGLGAEYALGPGLTAYGNITQAYRPVTYDNLTPFASTAKVNPHLKDARGYTSDLGIRGTAGPLSGDIDAFYLWYGDRIGTVALTPTVAEVTNVADSRHYGLESYVELALVRSALARASLFDSFAWVDAHYTGGPDRGNEVEFAPPVINRVGATVGLGAVSSTITWAYVARSFADATNVRSDPGNPGVGVIPSYQVVDWSARVQLGPRYRLDLGVDNLTNARYFTLRTNEYPGPGIIPANGRTAFLGVSATLP